MEGLPKAGYVLVDQRNEFAVNLIHTRTTSTRLVVSMGFVQESIARGEMVPDNELTLFIHEGKPALFHLHESLTEAEQMRLHDSIMVCPSWVGLFAQLVE